MKFLFTATVFVIIPVILCFALLYAVVPLLFQSLFRPKTVRSSEVFPYLTSWEEAA